MDNLLLIPSTHFDKSGFFHPNTTSILNLILIVSYIVVYFAQVIIFMVQFFLFQSNIDNFVDNIEGAGAYIQVLGKILAVLYHRKRISKLITLRKCFWKSDECSNEIQIELKDISSQVILFQRFMLAAFQLVLYTTLPMIIFFDKTLPVGSWQIPNQQNFYLVVLCLTAVTIPFLPNIVGNFDNLYLGFCFEMIKQFKILYSRIQQFNIEEVQSQSDLTFHYIKLKSAIQHHQFLIRYINEMKNIFSICLLLEFATIVPIIICEVYAVSVSSSLTTSIRYIVMGSAASAQLILYCMSADFLSQEGLKISTAIYSSNWYSKHFKIFRIPTVMLLRASQKEIEFTASGLIAVNARTLVQVFRAVLSINTLLRSVTD